MRLGIPLIFVLVVAGIAGLSISFEPGSIAYSLGGPPWLLSLDEGSLGVVYLKHGFSNGIDRSAVFYGVVNTGGLWTAGPTPVSPPNRPGPPGAIGPAGIVARIDERRLVHIAWALWDSERDDLSFHYVQLDPNGTVRAWTGPLANFTVPFVYSSVHLGIRVLLDEIQIVFPANGAANGTHMVTTLNLMGQIRSPPSLATGLDNASYFPLRQFPPGVSAATNEVLDSDASLVSDGPTTYYLWVNGRQWFEGRTYRSEMDLQFYRESPSGNVSRVLDSTEDGWWLTKPAVLPSLLSLVAAVSGTTVLMWHHFRQRKSKRS